MRKPVAILGAALLAAILFFFFQHFKIEGWNSLRVSQRPVTASPKTGAPVTAVSSTGRRDAIRIATWQLDPFDQAKLENSQTVARAAEIIGRFDVVALQGLRGTGPALLAKVKEYLNGASSSHNYDYIVGPPTGDPGQKTTFAFVFNERIVAAPSDEFYAVQDTDQLIVRDPFVGWFRVQSTPADQAFSFTLVNVHIDARDIERELNVLASVVREVQQDGRDEDDILLLGDLQASGENLGLLSSSHFFTSVLAGTGFESTTNIERTRQLDNILFHIPATVEFTDRAEVVDFLREHNLTVNEASELSTHLPVVAEFRFREGGDKHQLP